MLVVDARYHARWFAVAIGALFLCACKPSQSPPLKDKQALQIIELARTAPESIQHLALDMQQSELAIIARDQPPLSATEEKLYAMFTRHPQPDGSLILANRAHARYESLPPALTWMAYERIGGDRHVGVLFNDGENSYSFVTRIPDSISRKTIPAQERLKGPFILAWMARHLVEDSKQATTIRLRGRELTDGVLCDVIDISVPARKEEDGTDQERKEATYHIGVYDRLVHRAVEASGEPQRRRYRELLFTMDPSFVAQDISYARFEGEVKRLLDGKPLPPVVATLP